MTKQSLLQAALTRGLAPEGDLYEELSELGEYEIDSRSEAEALAKAMTEFVQRPLDSDEAVSAFPELTRLFQSVSRCHGGLCTSLPNLSRDSRILFLGRLIETGGSGNSRRLSAAEQRRAEHCPLTFAEPVQPTIEWLADHGPASPRDIVTILNRLGEHSLKRPSLIDVPFLQQWMSETLPAEIISLDSIVAEVANEFGIEPAELRSRSRHQSLIVPRQCAMFLARELTQRPLEFIGQYFGERTHTTVSHCLSRLKELLPNAPTLRQQVQRLQKRITELRREDCA